MSFETSSINKNHRLRIERRSIWECPEAQHICIPTNGSVRVSGNQGSMGAGLAKQARDLVPDLELKLYRDILEPFGNVFAFLSEANVDGRAVNLYAFPTKHSYKDALASMYLIEAGIHRMASLPTLHKVHYPGSADRVLFALPLLGCGCGGLDWGTQVFPMIAHMLYVQYPQHVHNILFVHK